jgi:hypothetical protein
LVVVPKSGDVGYLGVEAANELCWLEEIIPEVKKRNEEMQQNAITLAYKN